MAQHKAVTVQQYGDSGDSQLCSVQQADISVEIQHLLDKYDDVFREPTELPPKRPCDHQITLVPGAQPVHV